MEIFQFLLGCFFAEQYGDIVPIVLPFNSFWDASTVVYYFKHISIVRLSIPSGMLHSSYSCWRHVCGYSFQFLLGCFHGILNDVAKTVRSFQFLLGCFVEIVISYIETDFFCFQFLLGCFLGTACFGRGFRTFPFQFLLGCFNATEINTKSLCWWSFNSF